MTTIILILSLLANVALALACVYHVGLAVLQRKALRLLSEDNVALRALLAGADERTRKHRNQLSLVIIENHELSLMINQAYDKGFIARAMKDGREN